MQSRFIQKMKAGYVGALRDGLDVRAAQGVCPGGRAQWRAGFFASPALLVRHPPDIASADALPGLDL